MKVYLEVFGCTANKADANTAIGILKELNYEIIDDYSEA